MMGEHPKPRRVLNAAVIIATARSAIRAGEGVTMRGIAKTLGVSAAALYVHVSSVDDLLGQVAAQIDEDLALSVTGAAERVPDDGASGKLARALHEVRRWVLSDPNEFETLLQRAKAAPGGSDLMTVRTLLDLGPDVSAADWSRVLGALVLEFVGHADSGGLQRGDAFDSAVVELSGATALLDPARAASSMSKMHTS